MENNGEAKILRIFISNTDKFKHAPLYEMIVFAAKRYKMAGTTVLKGVMGFGSSSKIHSLKFWEITEKLPMVIEIIDDGEKITWFFEIIKPYLEKIKNGCIVTVEKANVVFFKEGSKN
jgi:PII-like signaling protein